MNFLKIILIMTIALTSMARGQVLIEGLSIDSTGRGIIYFSSMPDTVISALSQNKKEIMLKFPKAGRTDGLSDASSNTVITSMFATQKDDTITILARLNDKYGYTAAPMPISETILIDAFKWGDLSNSDESYRTGLLALEIKRRDEAFSEFKKAVELNHPDAAGMLGILLLQRGMTSSAYSYLIKAAENKTTIFDTYGALSLLHKFRGNDELARLYKRYFLASPSEGLREFQVSRVPEADTLVIDGYDAAEAEQKVINRMSEELGDTTRGDDKFDTLFAQDADTSAAAELNRSKGILPWWGEFAIMGVAALALLVLFFYLKWRNKQLQELKQKVNKKESNAKMLEEKKKKAHKTAEQKAIPKKGASGRFIDKTIDDDPKQIKKRSDEVTDLRNRTLKQDRKKTLRDSDKQEILDFISSLKGKQEERTETAEKGSARPAGNSSSAKLEMAMNLAKEQQKLKSKGIESLKKSDIPSDISKLTEVAKNLGIEKGSVETRKALDKLQNDKDYMSSLSKKFGGASQDENKNK
ncbi:MAG: hypothetical protein ACLFR2_05270 [Candidatus Kapaibacterium sp.]